VVLSCLASSAPPTPTPRTLRPSLQERKEGVKYGAEAGDAAEAPEAAAAENTHGPDAAPSGKRPKPAKWGGMTKAQRENWRKNTQARAKGKK